MTPIRRLHVCLLTLGIVGCDTSSGPSELPYDASPSTAADAAGGGSRDARVAEPGPELDAASGTSRDAGSAADAASRLDAGGSDRLDGGAAEAAFASDAATNDAGPKPGSVDGGDASLAPDAMVGPSEAIWKPKPGLRWQWDLSGQITKFDVAADVYDIDGFENDAAQVKRLHDMGKKVICYISVGTHEPARPDADDFPKAGLGKYWPEWGETYIDIRNEGVRKVMQKRLDMCKSKGFDGIEPDNMDMFEGGQSDTGFPLTKADGVAYAKWLAQEAHARGLSIGQKNASSITAEIEALYDWALTEDCYADDWCDDMKPYTAHDKAMFMCEYTDTDVDFAAACKAGKAQKFSPILKERDLTPWIQFCP